MKKRNIIGAAIMAAHILLAMPLGVARSMEDLREDALGSYYYDAAGYAIWEGIDKRQEAAHNLLTIAQKYQGENDELAPLIAELEYQVRTSENTYAEGSGAEVIANLEMGRAAEDLASALEGAGLAEKDKKYPAQMVAQMQSEQDKIERSSYNDAARQFNERLYAFPVNVLRHFTDVEELAAFDNPPALPGDAALAEGTAVMMEAEGYDKLPDAPDVPEVEAAEAADVVEEAG